MRLRALLFILAVGCGSKSPTQVTLTAVIDKHGTDFSGVARHEGGGLPLFCVTLTTPLATGTATAGADGKVSLSFEGKGRPFGCSVRDAAGKTIAAVIFVDGAANGLSLVVHADADLGAINLDAANGVAQAT